jgi:2',3'-cyclic-nucleotide 2'-phosphodiesterase
MTDTLNILCIGDVVGKPGRTLLAKHLYSITKEHKIDLHILNIENAAHGIGFNEKVYNELLSYGITVFTSGNHVYSKKEVVKNFNSYKKLIRPWNFPPSCPGQGVRFLEIKGTKIAVINLIGRVFMGLADCPFQLMQKEIKDLQKKADIILIDIHAEATSEKQALAWMLDGQVTAVFGTHTHVQTSDARLLPQKTAFISDIGMTGAQNSILGMEKDPIIKRFLNQMPIKFHPPETDQIIFNACKITVDLKTKQALDITPLKQEFML